jgi:putative transposase
LNETLFTLAHARAALDAWKHDYNTVRPHSGLGNLPPAVYAKLSESREATGRDAALTRGLRAPSRCTTEPDRLK